MTTRSFTVGADQSEPISFELAGTDINGQPIEPMVFRCLPEVQGRTLTDMIAKSREGDEMAAVQVIEFIRKCLVDEDLARFDEVTQGKSVVVSINVLGKILEYLIEAYANRPTEAPSGSPTGPTPTRPTSMDAATGSASQALVTSP